MPKGAQDNPQSALALQRLQPRCDQHQGCKESDVIARGIAVAAIIMLLGIGSTVIPSAVQAMLGKGPGPDRLLTIALLLNIVIVMLGSRRYRELTNEVALRRRAEEQAWLLAETDALTGLLNRRSLGPAANRLFAEAAAKGQAVALIMLDLDKFKQVNDLNGHAAGDTLLVEAASRLAELLPAGALLARIGGDEFACAVSYSPERPDQIDRLVERLIGAVARPVHFAGAEIETTISAGIAAHLPESSEDAPALLHNADIAMYHAKKRGRNRHCWFDPAMEQALRLRRELESRVRHGIAHDEFVPFYQKQVDLRTGQLTGFEMLARWEAAGLPRIGPNVFIPIAEEIGLIEALSESLIRKALIDARDWDPRLSLSINVSACQLRNPWFAQKLLKLMVTTNFPPSRLEIEITERALQENLALVGTTITSLKNQGVRIILDDFGTGQSALSRLRALPFDRIKIDRSLIATLNHCAESAAIVRSIVSLGEGLGLPITAEGIETEDALEQLCQFGDFRGQGYLYGQPQSGEATRLALSQQGLAPPSANPAAGEAGDGDALPAARIA